MKWLGSLLSFKMRFIESIYFINFINHKLSKTSKFINIIPKEIPTTGIPLSKPGCIHVRRALVYDGRNRKL